MLLNRSFGTRWLTPLSGSLIFLTLRVLEDSTMAMPLTWRRLWSQLKEEESRKRFIWWSRPHLPLANLGFQYFSGSSSSWRSLSGTAALSRSCWSLWNLTSERPCLRSCLSFTTLPVTIRLHIVKYLTPTLDSLTMWWSYCDDCGPFVWEVLSSIVQDIGLILVHVTNTFFIFRRRRLTVAYLRMVSSAAAVFSWPSQRRRVSYWWRTWR